MWIHLVLTITITKYHVSMALELQTKLSGELDTVTKLNKKVQ